MEKFSAHQIEQFLQIEKEVTGSADHIEIIDRSNFFGEGDDTVSSMTLTSTMSSGTILQR